ncbi:MAG: hypothetical protein NC299_16640 [Lachnospiraceae bacterium]|nr:hypothetical protein [Ruminococcus sp.]MCM1276965.1 hypothetical protein [Lachnospiraceae bacterium]
MNLFKKLKAPCAKCPYKAGLIKTLVNPCPACRMDGYRAFREFTESKSDKPESPETDISD